MNAPKPKIPRAGGPDLPEPHLPEPLESNMMNVASGTDFTGLIPAARQESDVGDAYAEFYPFEDE